MNNKGFTLVEIISVIALLALVIIITVPIIGNVSESVKKKTLNTKIDNIEKAAVLYGQDNRGNFNQTCNGLGQPCYNITVGECKCYKEIDDDNNEVIIDVNKLISSGLLKEDEIRGTDKVIVNPLDETKTLNLENMVNEMLNS